MMNRPRTTRYLGMTVTQIIILACLGLGICGTLVGGYGVLSALVTLQYSPAQPVLTEGPSPTPFTPVPTLTPLPSATPTSLPYESLIPAGWIPFTSPDVPGMEIWLPPTYQRYNESSDLEAVQVYNVDDEAARIVLSLLDTTQSPYLLFTTFEVGTQPMAAADLDEMIDNVFGALMRDARLMERGEFEIGDYAARKLVFDVNGNGVNAGFVIYPIQIETTVWYLGFATPFNELYSRMPTFDQIARTFRIRP